MKPPDLAAQALKVAEDPLNFFRLYNKQSPNSCVELLRLALWLGGLIQLAQSMTMAWTLENVCPWPAYPIHKASTLLARARPGPIVPHVSDCFLASKLATVEKEEVSPRGDKSDGQFLQQEIGPKKLPEFINILRVKRVENIYFNVRYITNEY